MHKSQDFLKYIRTKYLDFLSFPIKGYPFDCYQQEFCTLSMQDITT